MEAEKWVDRQNFTLAQIANVEFLRNVHQRMFGKTWRWAGRFRQTNKNIGVDWPSTFVDLKLLMDDVRFQIENNSYSVNECAVRFHHRLVAIHPFPNGNGRHARLSADILLLSQGMERFSWGKTEDLLQQSSMRSDYITALRKADRMDYSALIEFVQPTVTRDSESA